MTSLSQKGNRFNFNLFLVLPGGFALQTELGFDTPLRSSIDCAAFPEYGKSLKSDGQVLSVG